VHWVNRVRPSNTTAVADSKLALHVNSYFKLGNFVGNGCPGQLQYMLRGAYKKLRHTEMQWVFTKGNAFWLFADSVCDDVSMKYCSSSYGLRMEGVTQQYSLGSSTWISTCH
jgi:hypothetical protein